MSSSPSTTRSARAIRSFLLAGVVLGFSAVNARAVYDEPLRPLFHYSTAQGWSGDPNGMVFYDGEYHFSYQHTLVGTVADFGQMHWGHAISTDLVHWQNYPPVISPDTHSMWSGSTVVDWNNTAGFGHQALVAIYTAAGDPFTQCIAYSTDRGRTWTKYSGNPVLGNQIGGNRDPHVFWYAPQNKWVMSLWLDGGEYAFYSSPNLKNWTYLSSFHVPGVIEVPSLFPMPLNGNTNDMRWIFYCGAGAYYIGTFDGTTFTSQVGRLHLNEGNSFTAAQTFNDIPPSDGRRILISQGVQHFPGMQWENYYNFPVELTLRNVNDFVLHANPVREIEKLRLNTNSWPAQALAPGQNPMVGSTGEAFELDATFTPGTATQIGFVVRGQLVLYDNVQRRVFCNGLWRWLNPVNGQVRLHILVDRGVIEIFGNDGRLYMPLKADTSPGVRPVGMFVGGSGATLNSLKKHDLKNIWQ